MASRLYPTTRSIYRQAVNVLWALGVATLGSPKLFAFISFYVTGLILLYERQNQSRITRFLPGRCHDALNPLLWVIPLSTRMVMALLITFARSYGIQGSLCLDDVVIEKRFSKRCPWTGWTFWTSNGRKVYGLHIVVLTNNRKNKMNRLTLNRKVLTLVMAVIATLWLLAVAAPASGNPWVPPPSPCEQVREQVKVECPWWHPDYPWRNHRECVSCAAKIVSGAREAGFIYEEYASSIMNPIARSDCGKPHR